jgi:hypothetical protein
MTKHVFEVSSYGWFRHLGEYVKESPSFYTCRTEWAGKISEKRRGKTSGMRVFETDDPRSVAAAFEAKWKEYNLAIQEATEALRKVKHEQMSAALKAAFGEDA